MKSARELVGFLNDLIVNEIRREAYKDAGKLLNRFYRLKGSENDGMVDIWYAQEAILARAKEVCDAKEKGEGTGMSDQNETNKTVSKETRDVLVDCFDAQVWAKEFCKTTGFKDETWALGWFAHAIMTGHDIGFRKYGAENICLKALVKTRDEQLAVAVEALKKITLYQMESCPDGFVIDACKESLAKIEEIGSKG